MKFNQRFNLRSLAAIGAAATGVLASAAQAHPGHATSGFLSGFSHPLSGLDHMLAMLAVGLWAWQLGAKNKSALWAVPATFVGVMALGGVLGASGVALPLVETGIVASVLVLGVLIAAAARLPLTASVAIVAFFALFHGFAHGAEMPQSASGAEFGAGFVAATAMLHFAGIGAAALIQKAQARPQLVLMRGAGAAIALAGVLLAVIR
jgi:urease accessory protein